MKIRQIELYVGPFVDTENTSTATALKLLSTGASNELSVSFVVVKTVDSTLNKAAVQVENLNRETESKFNQENLAIELRCGWIDSGTGILTIHKGGLKIIDPQGDITRITSVDGAGASLFAVTNRSYSGQESLEQVVTDLVSDMPNIKVGKLSLTGKIGFKGRNFSGKTTDQLNMLAHQFGFTWSIQDGVFQAFMDSASTEKIYVFNDNTIEDIRPIRGADGSLTGFAMRSYLDPRINPGDIIEINSVSRPQYNGRYLDTKHTMTGQSHGEEWSSVFEMVKR